MKLPKPIIPVICTVLLLCSSAMQAQLPATAEGLEQSRLVTRATMYGVGLTNVFDTYLSPQEYTGIDFRVSRESMRMTRWMDGRLSLQSFFQADLGYTRNKADNNNTFSALANWNYGLHYNFPITGNFKLLAGGLADLNGGFVYNLRNTNNPASARAYINLDASGMAIWHTKIKNLSAGFALSGQSAGNRGHVLPHYGQSYYEIFTLGHASGVVRFTSLHNQPALRQMLSVDFPIRYTKMRLSYLCDLQQSKLNGIKTHTYSQVFMVGFVHDLFRIRNKNGIPLPPAVRAY